MTGSYSRIIRGPALQICMCAAMAANKYSLRRGPEMDEKRANEKGLSEERLESSPEVDKALYKHTQLLLIINYSKIFYCSSFEIFHL